MPEHNHDPRDLLRRHKYFSLRPRPLEQWLWRQGVAPSAERVFWLHWQEGMRNADWCSEVPLRRVAQQCSLDVSTVTRAYQQLITLGLIRRSDPGRDPANPFQQATAITEVRLPRELLVELNRHPNRPQCAAVAAASAADAQPPLAAKPAQNEASPAADTAPTPAPTPTPARADPFAGLPLRQRLRALAELTATMSAAERRQFDEAQRLHTTAMAFDEDTRLSAEQRGRVLQWLHIGALRPAAPLSTPTALARPIPHQPPPSSARKLTVFELSRLRRELQRLVEPAAVAERLREVTWSIEEGALQRFQSLHAMRIALKKIRDGVWSRPNRMPPNWARALTRTEACQTA